jgi:hypothetical protein
MTDAEMVMKAVTPIAFMVQQLPLDALDALIAEAERYDTAGPILDPTGWQRTHRNVAEHAVLLRAVRALRTAIDEIRERETARIGGAR